MSTLRTRIAGYPFIITDNEFLVCALSDNTTGKVGFFVNPENNAGPLPFELRSSFSQPEGQTLPILLAAHEAMVTLRERVEWTADSHGYSNPNCACEQCQIANAMYSRVFMAGRKALI